MIKFTFCFLAALLCANQTLLANETVTLRVGSAIWNAIQLPEGRCIEVGFGRGTPEPIAIPLQEDKDGNLGGTWESCINIEQKASFSIEVLKQRNADRTRITSRIKNTDGLTISRSSFSLETNTTLSFPALEMEAPLEYAPHGCNSSASFKIAPIDK